VEAAEAVLVEDQEAEASAVEAALAVDQEVEDSTVDIITITDRFSLARDFTGTVTSAEDS
jgi:hypothetical protein